MNFLLTPIDNFLNTITIYRLMLYFLLFLWVIAVIFAFLGIIFLNPFSIIFSYFFITGVCWISNKIWAKLFKAPTNTESVYITAFILSLILQPASNPQDYFYLALVSILAIASKFIATINHKHIFNPAIFGVAAGALILNQQASWWIGTSQMLPFILIGGLLIVRKIQGFDLVITFFLIALAKPLFDAQLLFFSLVMLTEPQTTPPTRKKRILYGGLVGIFSTFLAPDLALLLGNIFSYLVSPKFKLLLTLESRKEIAKSTYEFIFHPSKTFNFLPGQYLEWTIDSKKSDQRGNRRYFTIASSPTKKDIHLGIKFYQPGSSFKQTLLEMKEGDTIVGSQLSGEFILPDDPNTPLVFMAGGIGITPFRSMVKYLFDLKEKRKVTLIYAAKTEEDIAYKDLFDQASNELGIKVIYQTEKQGRVDEKFIKETVSDLQNSIFYLSGPHGMVNTFEQLLKSMKVPSNHIKIDFFPGYA